MIGLFLLAGVTDAWVGAPSYLTAYSRVECRIDGDEGARQTFIFVKDIDVGPNAFPVVLVTAHSDGSTDIDFTKADGRPTTTSKADRQDGATLPPIHIAGDVGMTLTPSGATSFSYLVKTQVHFQTMGKDGQRTSGFADQETRGSCQLIAEKSR